MCFDTVLYKTIPLPLVSSSRLSHKPTRLCLTRRSALSMTITFTLCLQFKAISQAYEALSDEKKRSMTITFTLCFQFKAISQAYEALSDEKKRSMTITFTLCFQFKAISQAYEALSDEKKRSIYDHYLYLLFPVQGYLTSLRGYVG